MKVVILAGGLGSRLSEETDVKPKPMVEIGGKPILWHIMQHYSRFGFNEFVLALGYRGDVIKRYILEYTKLIDNLTIKLRTGDVMRHGTGSKCDWTVDLVDTGLNTQTGGRLKKLAPFIGNETFMMTYGDGVSDVNISDLLAFHARTAKSPRLRRCVRRLDSATCILKATSSRKFTEKPQTESGWINGGFFVLEPKILEFISSDETWFEREPLETCAAQRNSLHSSTTSSGSAWTLSAIDDFSKNCGPTETAPWAVPGAQ